MNRKIFIFIILLSLIFIIFFSVVIILNKPNTTAELNNENISSNYLANAEYLQSNTIETNSSKITLSPNAKLTFTKKYSVCGHSTNVCENISNDMVNLNLESFSNLYSDWKITDFEPTKVDLEKDISGYCGEHYLVKQLDGFIAIYKIDQANNLTLERQTEILTKYLPEGDLKDLYDGIIVYGKNNLNSYLENFE